MKPKTQIALGAEIFPGERIAVRRDGENLDVGLLAPLKDGKPLADNAEIVRLDNFDSESKDWQDAETIYKNERPRTSSGPAQVATAEYRRGYDRIFGKQKVGLA